MLTQLKGTSVGLEDFKKAKALFVMVKRLCVGDLLLVHYCCWRNKRQLGGTLKAKGPRRAYALLTSLLDGDDVRIFVVLHQAGRLDHGGHRSRTVDAVVNTFT